MRTTPLFAWFTVTRNAINTLDRLPVNALHHYKDLLPRSVRPGLPVNYGFAQQFLKALHI